MARAQSLSTPEIEPRNTNTEFICLRKYAAKKMPLAIWKVQKRSIVRTTEWVARDTTLPT